VVDLSGPSGRTGPQGDMLRVDGHFPFRVHLSEDTDETRERNNVPVAVVRLEIHATLHWPRHLDLPWQIELIPITDRTKSCGGR
jgi:hypothetical protein